MMHNENCLILIRHNCSGGMDWSIDGMGSQWNSASTEGMVCQFMNTDIFASLVGDF